MKKQYNILIGGAIALSLGVLPNAVAGAAPSQEEAAALRNVRERQSDASMLQNEARNRARAEAQRAAAATGQIAVEETERPKLDLPDTLKVQVNGFRITGQDVIPEAELQPLLDDKKGRLLTFKDLQDGADTLTRYFREKGYLVAHAYLPVQKINDGIVEYAVTVGSLDGFTINKPMANMRPTKATGLRRMLEPTRMTLRSAAAGSSMKMERPKPARTTTSLSMGTSSSTRRTST